MTNETFGGTLQILTSETFLYLTQERIIAKLTSLVGWERDQPRSPERMETHPRLVQL